MATKLRTCKDCGVEFLTATDRSICTNCESGVTVCKCYSETRRELTVTVTMLCGRSEDEILKALIDCLETKLDGGEIVIDLKYGRAIS